MRVRARWVTCRGLLWPHVTAARPMRLLPVATSSRQPHHCLHMASYLLSQQVTFPDEMFTQFKMESRNWIEYIRPRAPIGELHYTQTFFEAIIGLKNIKEYSIIFLLKNKTIVNIKTYTRRTNLNWLYKCGILIQYFMVQTNLTYYYVFTIYLGKYRSFWTITDKKQGNIYYNLICIILGWIKQL